MRRLFAVICCSVLCWAFVWAEPTSTGTTENKTVETTTTGEGRGGSVTFSGGGNSLTFGANEDSSSTVKTTHDNLTGTSKTEGSSSQSESQTVGVSHKDGNSTYGASGKITSSSSQSEDGTSSSSSGGSLGGSKTTVETKTNADGSTTTTTVKDNVAGNYSTSQSTKKDGNTTTTTGIGLNGGQTTTEKTTNKDGSTTTVTHGENANIGNKISSDGTGGVTIGAGETHKIETSKTYGTEGGTSGETHASGESNASVTYTAGTTENGVAVKLEGDISVRGKAGVSGQYGTDEYNVHGSGEIEVSAELVAKLQAVAEVSPDGTVTIKGGGEIGAAATVEGTIKGGITVMGVPVDVVLSGGVSAGAKASAEAGFEFDATTGKAKLTLEASAVLGVGAEGSITVELGVDQLKDLLIGKVRDTVDRVVTEALGGDQSEYIRDVLNSNGWEEMFRKIAQHELEKAKVKVSIDDLLEMIKKGGLAGDIFRYLDALKDEDYERAMQIMRKIQEDIRNYTISISGGPLDSDPDEGGSNGSGGSDSSRGGDASRQTKPVGLTPFKVY